jgi:uncharacterized protein (DUF362 family)
MNNKVFISCHKGAVYPDAIDYFSPSEMFPEYKYTNISGTPNYVYRMVRECLIGLQMDEKNFGTSSWNPFGEIIKEGDSVVIKPNMVKHENPSAGLDCLITHVSIVRAVIDYVLIALKGTGRVIIGDAPVQTCVFGELKKYAGYNQLIDFYREKGVDIDIVDFRGTVSHRMPNGALIQEHNSWSKNNSVLVDLGTDSAFSCKENIGNLRITNYAPEDLLLHHNEIKHEYLINRDILNADVIINIPKPKTHRKAGITGAMKNMVGVSVEKEYLPHHTQNSIEEGGDEYPNKNILKKLNSKLLDRIDRANKNGQYKISSLFNLFSRGLVGVMKVLGNNTESRIREGSWYGNDTIWRTVNDLNRIVFHSDNTGALQEKVVRKMFVIADMIIMGEGEGPLAPIPKEKGMLIAGINPYDIDYVISSLMGINPDDIPCIKNAANEYKYSLRSNNPTVDSNDSGLAFESIGSMNYRAFEHVKMPNGWHEI